MTALSFINLKVQIAKLKESDLRQRISQQGSIG